MVRQSSRKKTNTRKLILIFVIAVLFLAVLFVVLKATHVIFPPAVTTSSNTNTASQTTKGESPTTSNNQAASNANSETNDSGPVDKNGDATVEPTVDLLTPTGTFVSNHHINLSDSNQLSVQSNCSTTPDVSCSISFTNGSVTKTLPAATTDAGGSAYWSWNIKKVGLTAGTWKVVATASSGSSTKTAADAMDLEVTQ